ncbi:MAG: cell division topological specificity factor MinE [Salinisphaera sp.]|nr:cell division topological specificity factor MinE [Salinisphaera sp.]
MSFLAFFRSQRPGSAQLAKERLQVVVAHRRANRGDHPAWFPKLQKDLLRVLRKYIEVQDDAVQIGIERDGDLEVLELNITLPERG